jgi:hypothetical protein
MIEEAAQDRRAAGEAAEAAPAGAPQRVDRVGQRVAHLPLDHSIAQLLGVQLRRVRRQPLELVVGRVGGDEGLHGPCPMGLESVPDNHQRLPHPAAEVAQGGDDLGAVDAAGEMTGIEPRRSIQRGHQARDTRHLSALAHPSEQGRMPTGSPGGGYAGPKRVTRLVHEDNGAPCAASPFFMRGQSRWSQASTRVSSRSLARGRGRWRLQPRARSARPKERG